MIESIWVVEVVAWVYWDKANAKATGPSKAKYSR